MKTKTLKLVSLAVMTFSFGLLLVGCGDSKEDNASNTAVKTALNKKSDVTYDISYIDQEAKNTNSTDNYYSTDVIGYMNGDKEEQLRISLKNSMPSNNITYRTKILTNPDAKATVNIKISDKHTTITVSRQPYQRYIQPNVSGTVSNKEENK